jgi:hypothetical protein
MVTRSHLEIRVFFSFWKRRIFEGFWYFAAYKEGAFCPTGGLVGLVQNIAAIGFHKIKGLEGSF